MTAHEQAMQQPLDELTEQATAALVEVLDPLVEWTAKVRPADGTLGRFRWAIESTRPANVAATAYVLGGLRRAGVLDCVWTDADRRAAVKWIRGMHVGDEQYRDPALMDRPTPGRPSDEPWPSPAMLGGINQYARNVLRSCTDDVDRLPPDSPPPGWPQADDDPAAMLEWIRTRPYQENAWGACSHGMRMATYMLRWHKEGRMPLRPLIEAIDFFYSIQDAETGLWGTADQPKNVRINGTFKLFPLMRENLDLPLPHADRIIDQVLAEFARPDYDASVGACDEWDNWYVVALALDEAGGHRDEEVRRTAAWRIIRSLEIFRRRDGGLSYWPTHCMTGWIGFDMAPQLPQGDAMGPGVLFGGLNVCIDLLGLHAATPWTGRWRMREKEDEPIRQAILAGMEDRP